MLTAYDKGEVGDMATYEQARLNEFKAAAGHTFSGVELDIAEDSPLAEGGRIPIHLCLCVTEPCDCPGPIIWTLPGDILSRESTERTNQAGEFVSEFKIDPDATVLVESVVRAKATALQAGSRRLLFKPESRLSFTKPDCGCDGPRSARDAPGTYYGGQACAGHTMYEVWEEHDGLKTVFHYIPVGSC
jgi:hypothetical protein